MQIHPTTFQMIKAQELVIQEPIIKTPEQQNLKIGQKQPMNSKVQKAQSFQDLLMTFCFNFRQLNDYSYFCAKIIQKMVDIIDVSYPYDFVYMNQLSLTTQNQILIDEPLNSLRMSQMLQQPEVYFPKRTSECQQTLRNKKLAYSVGLILLELLCQRPITQVPPKMSAEQYSKYIYRGGKLHLLVDLISEGAFGQIEYGITHRRYSEQGQIIARILNGMLEENPMSRQTLNESLVLFLAYSTDANMNITRMINSAHTKSIQRYISQDSTYTYKNVKNLVIQMMNDGQGKNCIAEEALKMKEYIKETNLEQSILEIKNMLVKIYQDTQEQKFFAYLQQFYIHFFRGIDRSLVAEQLPRAAGVDTMEIDEYINAPNVFMFCAKIGILCGVNEM